MVGAGSAPKSGGDMNLIVVLLMNAAPTSPIGCGPMFAETQFADGFSARLLR
jgi:hypothetical protein